MYDNSDLQRNGLDPHCYGYEFKLKSSLVIKKRSTLRLYNNSVFTSVVSFGDSAYNSSLRKSGHIPLRLFGVQYRLEGEILTNFEIFASKMIKNGVKTLKQVKKVGNKMTDDLPKRFYRSADRFTLSMEKMLNKIGDKIMYIWSGKQN
mmetsp:Transcript_29838/g.42567  ORF Transcript_29838/g.42567 Transcript_29838/m.42567 type:complete len:148 (-) Transcript_29838:53-496(-)